MDCEQASEIMQDRLDGLSATADILRLEEHLAGCTRCQSEWRRLQLLDNLFASAQMVSAPPYLRVRLIAAMAQRDRARRAALTCTVLALGCVTLALFLFVPAILNLLSATSGVTAVLLSGGLVTINQLLSHAGVLGRTILILLTRLIPPLAAPGLCSLLVALGLNRLLTGLSQARKPDIVIRRIL